ncbi:lipocalin-like domain-containing protein [Marinobacter sp. OP 3.4]|uniref:lipocalin-like domain-containing protein n=1 Tax=Marinobacter sp. OP 3.4 TaxID=3076501 RepID=UPI002E1B2177
MNWTALFLAWLAGLSLILSGCGESPDTEGFAGLAETPPASSFAQPSPSDGIELPDDWGPHPDHRIEWWYLTANLRTEGGDPLGLQWTQFRQGLVAPDQAGGSPPASRWPLQAAWMAHGAVSFRGQHWFSERFARGGIGQAGAQAEPLRVWLDHWQLEATGSNQWRLEASGDGWSYRLTLVPGERVIRHGDQGFSVKSDSGFGSMYFSLVDIGITGTVKVDGTEYRVAGTGWLDREWSSQFLRSDQQGWDWFALRLDNGGRLMAFRVGRGGEAFRSGTWVAADGSVHALSGDQVEMVPLTSRETDHGQVPAAWRIRVPAHGVDITVRAPEGEYWNRGLYPYWESPVTVTGSHRGEGYMELTGYARP